MAPTLLLPPLPPELLESVVEPEVPLEPVLPDPLAELVVLEDLDVVVDARVAELDVVPVPVAASRTNCGWSIMETIVDDEKHRYMDLAGLPVQRRVPQAPKVDV
jgi:hypothetical protein